MSALQEDQCACFIITGSIVLRMRNVSHKRCRENQNTVIFFFFENSAVYEIMCKNILEGSRTQMTMAYAHCILDT